MFRRAQAVQEANQALSEERQHLRGLFEQAPGFMAALSGPDHVFTMANAAYLQLVGRENIIGKPVREALPEVVGQGFLDLLDRVYRQRPALRRPKHPHPPGAGRGRTIRRSASWTSSISRSSTPSGQVSGIFVQGHDVTEQKRTEEALRESEERFRAIANSIDQLIWATQPDGYHDYYNQRWYEYTGVPEGSTDGEAWNGMFHPEDQDRAPGTSGATALRRASRIISNTGCGIAPANIAGFSGGRSRFATSKAGSRAGSAPAPISMI